MENKLNLKEIEQNAYKTYHGDGLWDIFLGLFLFSIGIFMILDVPYLMGIIPATMLPSVMGAKKSFVRPRLGYVKFSPDRQAKEKKGKSRMQMIFLFTVTLGLVFFVAFTGNGDWQNSLRSLKILPFGAVLALCIGAVGFFFDIKRFIVYAGIIIGVFVAAHFANSEPPVQFLIVGIIIFAVGLVLLVRFVRKYPRQGGEEMPHVS